jgi:hypothetical protein
VNTRYAPDPEFDRAAPADTPPGAEGRLEDYQDALEEATKALTEARNAELEAEEARDKAAREWRLSDECPPVGVFGGIRTTVAYQDAWVADKIADLQHEYKVARETRRAASDHLRKLMKQGGWQQSITASVREQLRGYGGRP